ncbi:MAG: hypothetical protein IPM97_05470 [Bdellovibrionaceae bacterium]|nr:hypothetical protein [Pseudobdellovibrionaceae bacterium]
MKKKLQVILSDESWSALDILTKEANDSFANGSITFSDVVNEIILTAKLDIRGLQAKHTNIRKSLRLMAAQKEIDIDSAIRALMDLKTKGAKRTSKNQPFIEGVE